MTAHAVEAGAEERVVVEVGKEAGDLLRLPRDLTHLRVEDVAGSTAASLALLGAAATRMVDVRGTHGANQVGAALTGEVPTSTAKVTLRSVYTLRAWKGLLTVRMRSPTSVVVVFPKDRQLVEQIALLRCKKSVRSERKRLTGLPVVAGSVASIAGRLV